MTKIIEGTSRKIRIMTIADWLKDTAITIIKISNITTNIDRITQDQNK